MSKYSNCIGMRVVYRTKERLGEGTIVAEEAAPGNFAVDVHEWPRTVLELAPANITHVLVDEETLSDVQIQELCFLEVVRDEARRRDEHPMAVAKDLDATLLQLHERLSKGMLTGLTYLEAVSTAFSDALRDLRC